jgi:hypothetical protein
MYIIMNVTSILACCCRQVIDVYWAASRPINQLFKSGMSGLHWRCAVSLPCAPRARYRQVLIFNDLEFVASTGSASFFAPYARWRDFFQNFGDRVRGHERGLLLPMK